MSVVLSALAGAGQQFFDNNGKPLSGGLLYSYAAGTSSPSPTYTSNSGATAHPNPIVLDAAGRVPTGEIWLPIGTSYKFVLKTSNAVLLATWDNIDGLTASSATLTYTPGATSLLTANTVQSALDQLSDESTGSSVVGFKQPYTSAVSVTVDLKLQEWVSVVDFGADPTGATDSTLQIQAAMDTGKNVLFPYGNYLISNTLTINKSQILYGMGNPLINRAQVYINANGNFPAFEYAGVALFPQIIIKNFYIQFPGTATPTAAESATKGNRVGIKFTGAARWPEFIEIDNITVRFGWWAYYNNTGTYMGQLSNIHSRECRNGFQHRFGTTMTFTNCFASEASLGFYISNVLGCTMTNCAADTLDVKESSGFGGGTGCYFESVQGLTINGWDAEGNTIDADSGSGSTVTYWRFVDTYALVSGMIGLGTTLKTTGSGSGAGVCWIYAENNSNVTLIGCQDVESGSISYVGVGGYPATLQTDATSRINAIGCKFGAATGGTPAISTAATGANIAFTNSLVTGTNTGYSETKTSAGLQIPNVYTQRGDTAVGAGAATNIVSLSNTVQAVWLMSIWNPNAGTTYMTSALINFDGTNWVISYLKAGADLTLSISGTTVRATSTAATTLRWSIVRIA